MDDKKTLEDVSFKIRDLTNFTYENVRAATCVIIEKRSFSPRIVHYESTNTSWKNFYINAKEAEFCHLMRRCAQLSKHVDTFSLVWNLTPPDNQESIFIDEKRIDLDHCNGISICKNISDELLLAVVVCGPHHHINFANVFLKNKKSFLKNLFH